MVNHSAAWSIPAWHLVNARMHPTPAVPLAITRNVCVYDASSFALVVAIRIRRVAVDVGTLL
jgi:hypothetical protein